MEIVAVAGRPVFDGGNPEGDGPAQADLLPIDPDASGSGPCRSAVGDGRVVIGERLIRIALLGKSDVDVRKAAAPLLKAAAVQFNETVFLARFRETQVEIIHVETPNDPARAYVHPGLGVRPMHACSCSKAIAAFAEPQFQDCDHRRHA